VYLCIFLKPLRTSDESLTTDSVRKAELLRSVFLTAFTKDDGLLPFGSFNPVDKIKLSTITFTPTPVKRVIRQISGNAKGDPDDIPPLFLNNVVINYRRHWPSYLIAV
jgi:hypothetical protein